jgi:hypothetical protein
MRHILVSVRVYVYSVGLAQRRAARFVAMIPFIQDTEAFIASCELWATTDQMFQMLSGGLDFIICRNTTLKLLSFRLIVRLV